MEASKLYEQLEKDFIFPELVDDWSKETFDISDFICDQYKKRFMGLVCDNTQKINKVYTAVFPSIKVMQSVLDKNETDIMLFVHHPAVWDIRKAPQVFQPMDKDLLKFFKNKRISIYNLHVPLDNFSDYSTSVSLANKLDIKIDKKIVPYHGAMAGIIGTTEFKNIKDLKAKFELIIGHKAGFYKNNGDEIKNQKIAVVAGGGNDLEILKEVFDEGVNTFITGITAKNNHSKLAHDFSKENKINVLGGTHYSTEKFACIAMCQYFQKNNLPSEFIDDFPVLEDL
jgi:putative NIF3 family GTP cyclohydrolase 1 type 2